jgi:hypothetical protein
VSSSPLSTVESGPEVRGCDGLASWRGDTGLFPIAEGVSYVEFAAETRPDGFGDNLESGDENCCRKRLVLPIDPAEFAHAELLVFGNGLIRGPSCRVNGHDVPLQTLAEFTVGRDVYPTCTRSVNRSYSLAGVPLTILQRGENTVGFGACHAYLQTIVLRLFRAGSPAVRLKLAVEEAGESYRLRLNGDSPAPLREVQFFARFRGPDLEMSGREVTWRATVNKDASRAGDYAVANHCGTAVSAPWSVSWKPEFVPDGPIAFRARVQLDDGTWIESPGGIVERRHDAKQTVYVMPAQGFFPWYFHANGANQEQTQLCRFELSESVRRNARDVRRAVLELPLYGDVELELNGRHRLSVGAPLAGYYVERIDLPLAAVYSRYNHLRLKPSGGTGCFQAPGPVLYMLFDSQP